MSKGKHVPVLASMLTAVFLFAIEGCVPASPATPATPDSECGLLRAELDKANAELEKLKVQLESARAEIATVKAASLEDLLRQRRSVRDYADAPLTQDEVMKLLWAAQGITRSWGGRTAPSAGALYPLELYVAVGNVMDLSPGIYKYDPGRNKLTLIKEGDVRTALALASLGQRSVADGAINIVIAAVYERTMVKYGTRGERYVHIEVGHAAQNICLQAVALGLGLVTIGAFQDSAVAKIIGMSPDEAPLYVIPVGRLK